MPQSLAATQFFNGTIANLPGSFFSLPPVLLSPLRRLIVIRELDIVTLTRDMPDHGLAKNAQGAVVH
jgi:hypothetical protein